MGRNATGERLAADGRHCKGRVMLVFSGKGVPAGLAGNDGSQRLHETRLTTAGKNGSEIHPGVGKEAASRPAGSGNADTVALATEVP